jgi:hypothetical protein
MMRMMVLGSALLLTASSLAQAEESQGPEGAALEAGPTEENPASAPIPPVPPQAEPLPSPPAQAEPPAQAQIVEPMPQPPAQPEPYTGWGRGQRAPMYLVMMLSVGALREDGNNRLTTRDSRILEGFGGILRVGAVLNQHHRLGARMQSLVRPTKKVLRDPPVDTTTDSEWGAVSFGYAGPEYLYNTDFGLYAGGSLGIAGLVSNSKTNDDSSDDDNHVERGSVGVGAIVSLGYEWRANKWFAMNADAFAGYYHGIDDNESSMNSIVFGLGMGMGF